MTDHANVNRKGPMKKVAKFFRNRAKNGNWYFRGTLEGTTYMLMNSGYKATNGNEIWNLCISGDEREPGEDE
jgi:hypothetical protein